MLTESEFSEWVRSLGYSESAIATIRAIRTAPPTRRVGGGSENSPVRYPSRKMGVTIQAESHTNEFPTLYCMEHDPSFLEFWDQPPTIPIAYQSATGRRIGARHTPDYFVIRDTGAGWVECKMEEHLLALAKENPNKFVRDEQGHWRCPPGEVFAEQFGLMYTVHSSNEIDWVLFRNLGFLEDYLRVSSPGALVTAETRQAVCDLVASNPGVRLRDLIEHVQGEQIALADEVYFLLVMDHIYVDLSQQILAEYDYTQVFPDKQTADAYSYMRSSAPSDGVPPPAYLSLHENATILWDGVPWKVLNVGVRQTSMMRLDDEEHQIIHLPEDQLITLIRAGALVSVVDGTTDGAADKARELMQRAGPAELAVANARYQALVPLLVVKESRFGDEADHIGRAWDSGQARSVQASNEARQDAVSERTLRRWLKAYRRAEELYDSGYVGLLPRTADRGNATERLDPRVVALMETFATQHYETVKQKRKLAVHGQLCLACQKEGLTPPSYPAWCRFLKRRPQHEQDKKRRGRRVAYGSKPFYWELTQTTPRHGDRPFQIVHIDHTELDVELIDPHTDQRLGRPWVTFMTDAFTRRLLAVYVTYEEPSYRSVMMTLRECVRRFGRLPQMIVVDNGPEFGSVYLETLMARYAISKKERPSGSPRGGAVIERLFDTANTQFVHNLEGNTQIMKNVRQVTKSVNPKRHASWTLGRLYARLRQWAYEAYDNRPHPALGQSPRQAFEQGIALGGARHFMHIAYDEDFLRDTLPEPERGTRKVQQGQGVKIGNVYYWHDAFTGIVGTKVRVRNDPFNIGLAYAFVKVLNAGTPDNTSDTNDNAPVSPPKGRWVECTSEYYTRLRGRTEKEVQAASAELRQRARLRGESLTISALKLAEFLDSVEAEEAWTQKMAQARANRDVVDTINANGPERVADSDVVVEFDRLHDSPPQDTSPSVGAHPAAAMPPKSSKRGDDEGNRSAADHPRPTRLRALPVTLDAADLCTVDSGIQRSSTFTTKASGDQP